MTVTAGIGRRLGEMAATLWDLLGLADPDRDGPETTTDAPGIEPVTTTRATVTTTTTTTTTAEIVVARPPSAAGRTVGRRAGGGAMQARYDALVREMKQAYGVRVVRWRSSTSGCAWQVHYADGSTARLIESPYPRGPMSCAVFLHEIGHHAIGFGTYRPRCLEEYHAWRWSFEAMIAGGFNVTEAVRRRRDEALHYAIRKAARRGLKRLPVELAPFVPVPDRGRSPLPALLPPSSADDAA
jgi:hypothetical protein